MSKFIAGSEILPRQRNLPNFALISLVNLNLNALISGRNQNINFATQFCGENYKIITFAAILR